MRSCFLIIFLVGVSRFASAGYTVAADSATCHAAFAANPEPMNPLTFHFQDQSTGQITHWYWSFGDGVTTTLQNPVHSYTAGGQYFVCLTVSNSDSGFICHDMTCILITVHEPGSCIADYTYAIDSLNQLKTNFSDQSTGNINSWHWDFGDGTVSGERNPVHLFPAFGAYHVCLTAYNSDSISVCNDLKCDSISLIPSVPCHASFTSVLDSFNLKPNTFNFHSSSGGDPNHYRWTFDDGGSYSSHNVTHQFLAEGNHTVCLYISKEVQGVTVCRDSLCQTVTTAKYFDLGGHLFTGDYPINNPVSTGDTGIVCLYRLDGSNLVPFDTNRFTHLGYYAFPKILHGSYIARATLTAGSAHYSDYFPAYFPQQLKWAEASVLNLSDSNVYASHIHLLQAGSLLPGPGRINGKVVEAGSAGTSGGIPLAEVILYDGQQNPMLFRMTDQQGRFEMNNLPYGEYKLYVEIPGRYSRMTAIWLDSLTPVAGNVRLEVFDHDVTGISDPAGSSILSGELFPNPAPGDVSIMMNCKTSTGLKIEVRSMTGQLAWAGSMVCQSGSTLVTFPLKPIRAGVYLFIIRISDGSQVLAKKLIKY